MWLENTFNNYLQFGQVWERISPYIKLNWPSSLVFLGFLPTAHECNEMCLWKSSLHLMNNYFHVEKPGYGLQLNLDYPYLDYSDFLTTRTFSLVTILSWIFISHDQDP